jgi:hypothetical protein
MERADHNIVIFDFMLDLPAQEPPIYLEWEHGVGLVAIAMSELSLSRISLLGKMVMLVAALLVATNSHLIHAQSGPATPGQLESICQDLNPDVASLDSAENASSYHGDCIQHFDPIGHLPGLQGAGPMSQAKISSYSMSVSRSAPTSDPPPPRFPV